MPRKIDDPEDLSDLPGAAIVLQGISDLEQHKLTEPALLVLIAAPRLRGLGLTIEPRKQFSQSPEHALYGLLEESQGPHAHSYYLSLIRLIVSFARALGQRR